jgi:hypothetical protein
VQVQFFAFCMIQNLSLSCDKKIIQMRDAQFSVPNAQNLSQTA